MNDLSLLDTVPSYLSISHMLKAVPHEESGERFIYLEASNESLDLQNETVLCKALADSADYYMRYGNIDIDHITQVGAKSGIPDYNLYEIGRPVQVKVDGKFTFVKGQIIKGTGPVAEKANQFWESITAVTPPQRWYPSVGGSVLEKSIEINPQTRAKMAVITKVRWTNLGMSRTPVNQMVPTISTVPYGVLAKCWGAGGLDIQKALEAGYGTDVATLEGGGALRNQSLEGKPLNYFDFRDRVSGALMKKQMPSPNAARLVDFAVTKYGMSRADAAEWVERFMLDINASLKKRRK